MRAVLMMSSAVSALGASASGMWMVTGTTASVSDQIIMTGKAGAPQALASSPRYSVCPGCLNPAS